MIRERKMQGDVKSHKEGIGMRWDSYGPGQLWTGQLWTRTAMDQDCYGP